MADEGTGIRRASASHDLEAGSALSALLAMTSDAVIVFDGGGTVLAANDEALCLLAPSPMPEGAQLVGTDVRMLFPPALGVAPHLPFFPEQLPLPTDGRAVRISHRAADGRALALVMRCGRIGAQGDGDAFLITAHTDAGAAADREHERLVEELSRSNRRLSGTLDIVLGTLDSPSVSTLFERVLERLRDTMDATGTAVYLGEGDGFRLRGTSASIADVPVPRFLPHQHALTRAVAQAEHALRLRMLPPDGESLRKGSLAHRTLMDEDSRATYHVRRGQLPPFTSLLAVPVRFGGQVIALIEVGWRNARAIPQDDANLLDAVTRYLAVQLVGAFGAMRAQRREQLVARANDLRDKIVAGPYSEQTRLGLLDAVSHDLDCACATLDGPSAIDAHEVLRLPTSHEEVAVPTSLLGSDEGVTALLPDAPLGVWLQERGEPCMGAMVDAREIDDGRLRFLALRPADAEPFDELELDYLRQVVDTIVAVASGEQGRRSDHRISQALQSGMRSELQSVEGISARGLYSSATKAAFVGGDFYDLIRLPGQRACVIMGDVSGKGVEAASVSAAVRTALGAYAWEGLAPARMVGLLNDFLLGFSRVETFATLFVGIIDRPSATLTYCSAGHPPAILMRAASGALEWLGVQSGVVGAFHDMTYRDGSIGLHGGDTLLLYTDGTTEARARDGRFFGEDGLRDVALREAAHGFEGLLDRVLAAVDDFTGNSLDDDVALVALRFDEVGQEG